MDLPLLGGAAGLLALTVAFIRFLLADPAKSQQAEIVGLRDELAAERQARRDDIARLEARQHELELLYDESRREKHAAMNELTKAQVLLGLIIDLAEKCTCGALDIVEDILARAVPNEHAHRRTSQ